MPLDPFQELLLKNLEDLKISVNEVRTKDIPQIRADVAGFHGQLKTLKKNQSWETRIYTVIGGAIAVALAKFTGHQ